MFCKSCWANLPDGTKVCPRCGKDPGTAPEDKKPAARRKGLRAHRASPPGGQTTTLSWLVTIFIIAAVAGGVYYRHVTKPPERESNPEEYRFVIEALKEADGTMAAAPGADEAARAPAVEAGVADGTVLPDAREGLSAMKAGDYLKASILFRRALDGSPDNPALRTNLARSLAAMAWQSFEGADYARSKDLFGEAISVEEEPSFVKGLAFAQARSGELEDAAATLEGLLAKGGYDAESKGLLKGVYAKLGERRQSGGRPGEAVTYYEKAMRLDPSDHALGARVEELRREGSYEAGFREKQGGHFNVKFDGGENAVTGHVISLLLEEAYIKIGADLGYHPQDRITAVLYSRESFSDVTRSPSWAGAIYDGRIKIPAGGVTQKTRSLEKVIFHEYTHAVVHRLSGGRAPVWLNEGLAQYFEDKRAGEYEEAVKGAVTGGKASLRPLEGSFMRFSNDEAETAYALSLSAAEYLVTEYSPYAAKKVLEEIGRGKTVDRALFSAIYLSYDQFEQAWLRSTRRGLSLN